MSVKLIRYYAGEFDTLGLLYINGGFACYTLEDPKQQVKIKHNSCIPAGTYFLGLHNSPKFSKEYNHDMLWIKNVPGFEYILIHWGNSNADTSGCILVGNGISIAKGARSFLSHSKIAYERVYPLIANGVDGGTKMIEIVEQFG